MTLDLFDDQPTPDFEWLPGWMGAKLASDIQRDLLVEVPWRQEHLQVAGTTVALPRLTCWQGDEAAVYTYSGIRNAPSRWSPTVLELKEMVEAHTGTQFNRVLLSLYRDGQDHIGWHAHDEPELGPEPIIASLSLGVTRRFEFRHRHSRTFYALELSHGTMLIMKGRTQLDWRHRIDMESQTSGELLNITFKRVAPTGKD